MVAVYSSAIFINFSLTLYYFIIITYIIINATIFSLQLIKTRII